MKFLKKRKLRKGTEHLSEAGVPAVFLLKKKGLLLGGLKCRAGSAHRLHAAGFGGDCFVVLVGWEDPGAPALPAF